MAGISRERPRIAVCEVGPPISVTKARTFSLSIIAVSEGELVDDTDTRKPWTLEMDNRRELAELGFAENTLRPGDRIVVTGNLDRRRPHSLYVRKLDHPADGFSYEHHP